MKQDVSELRVSTCFHWHSRDLTSPPTTGEFSAEPHGIRQLVRAEVVESWELKLTKPWPCHPHGSPWNSYLRVALGVENDDDKWQLDQQCMTQIGSLIITYHYNSLHIYSTTILVSCSTSLQPVPQEAKLITHLSINQSISSLPPGTFGPPFAWNLQEAAPHSDLC